MRSVVAEFRLPADPEATQRFGRWLGAHLRAGDVVGLVGQLGAGKTTLVRGLAAGLGCEDADAVASPTYLLVVEHPGPVPLLHADAYLPDKLRGFLDDGGLDYLLDARAVTVVEWADLVHKYLPESTLWIHLHLEPDAGRRVLVQRTEGDGFAWIDAAPKMGFGD
ncbi:MAG: tRNA (adenosine(37)-N6)-threonylcarbamoyltransferase complex ATPase subunit type 1 TsaE [Planctomycetes bacterium]|nr:tRNA (adenosine(37)-N6)-threonylcarbamoyltransferase complex ATPase subunit type 1 TsaE [Planctomycetota bacterium]